MRNTIIACVIVALVVGATSATAAKLVTGSDIKNGSITGADIKNPTIDSEDIKKGAVIKKKLSKAVRDALENQEPPAQGRKRATRGSKGRSVQCAPGKVALGGGYTAAADASDDDKQDTQIVTSQPAQIVNGNPDAYTPIAGDPVRT